ncbi:hypothetical protein LZ30DRAFT_611405 [Colletotrichum cereale]|nr:hypothetical protein LZ30DRAFT_611405 [Colletotrichum cereale]
MKASIIQALIVALVASVEVTEACGLFRQCRCTMADGSINNTVTEIACQTERDNTQNAHGSDSTALLPSTDANNVTWCNKGRGNAGHTTINVDNCAFRETCTALGATGADSWCEDNVNE